MSISLNSTFDKSPSSGIDILQTFDLATEEDNISSAFSYLQSDKYPAMAFTQALFERRPDLFGTLGMSLIYAQHSGTSYKAEAIYSMFESFIRYGPATLVKQSQIRAIGPYEFCPNFLILWAKLLRNTRMTIAFEPIMTKLNRVLNDYFQSKKITFKGISYDLSIFKPLCYTKSGECYFPLLPYIAYLVTFLVDCRPFAFNEAHTESSSFGFFTSLNAYFQKYYTAFREDTNVDLPKLGVNGIPSNVSDKQLSDMIKVMLHPDRIMKIRNDEIQKTPELLVECIRDQSDLTDKYVNDAFHNTLTRLLKIIIQQGPLKAVYDSIPRFKNDNKNINIRELLTWTEYCVAGGDSDFIIENGIHSIKKDILNDYSTIRHMDPAKIQRYPDYICTRGKLTSDIKPLTICQKQPFCENDVILNMAMGYFAKRYDVKRNDILDENPININEPMLWQNNVFKQPYAVVLKNLFINGIWANDNSTMSKVLGTLSTDPEFVSEINDIISLVNVTQIVYNNRLASVVIGTYLLSYLNSWILDTIVNGYNLRLFRPFRYIVRMNADMNRIGKLCDMVTSLMFISHEKYARFVNGVMSEFMTIMETQPIILQPYVKRLADLADVYAIGGCELYKWSSHQNPIVRGTMWHYNVFGSSEELETFYLWTSMLDNSALMDLLETNINNTSIIDATLKTQIEKMIEMRKYPVLLSNYELDGNLNYKEKRFAYMLSLTTSAKVNMLGLISKRVFKRSLANQSTAESIWFKRLLYKTGEIVAKKSTKNSMEVNDKALPAMISEGGIMMVVPIYDLVGKLDEMKVIFTTPGGYRLIQIVMGNSRNGKNQSMLIYTKVPVTTRFTGKFVK